MEIIFLLANLILSIIGIPMLMNMFNKNQLTRPNYRGEYIPICLGLIFSFIQLITVSLYAYFNKDNIYIYYLLASISMALIGLLDDLAGDIEVKGLKGHIGSFLKGDLTTGFIKAAFGFFIALVLSLTNEAGPLEIILDTFIIALSINTLNLFDLRPGRSLKVFFFLSILFLILSKFKNHMLISPLLIIAIIYFPYDVRAKSMMGDTGSNVLGLSIGYYCSVSQVRQVKLIYLLFIVVLHVVAERKSFSEIIENNKILNYIDKLGR